MGFLETCYNFVIASKTQFVAPKTLQQCLKYILYAIQVEFIVKKINFQLEAFLFDICIPLLAINQKDEENWNKDPAMFLYSQVSRLDDHNGVKSASLSLMEYILKLNDENDVPMEKKFINYIGSCLEKNTNLRENCELNPIMKDCFISALIHCHKMFELEKEEEIVEIVDKIIQGFLFKELFSEHEIIKARVCHLLYKYGTQYVGLEDTETHLLLCNGLDNCLNSNKIPVQINALLALNRSCANQSVISYFEPQIEKILQVIEKCMSSIDYKELIYSAEGLIKEFSHLLAPYALPILQLFNSCYYKYLDHYKFEYDEEDCLIFEIDDDEYDDDSIASESIFAAAACLETIRTVLDLKLGPEIQKKGYDIVMNMIADTILVQNTEIFLSSLSLLNLILYQEPVITDELKFFFPILIYVIIGKPKGRNLTSEISQLPENFREIFSESTNLEKFSDDFVGPSLGCFLNYVSKLGESLYTTTDFYGINFSELLMAYIEKIISDALTGPCDKEIIFVLIIVKVVFQTAKDRFEIPNLSIWTASLCRLLTESSRTDQLRMATLRAISVLIWLQPAKYLQEMSQADPTLLSNIFGGIFAASSEQLDEDGQEELLYGLVAVLEVDKYALQGFDLGLLMKAVLTKCVELVRSRAEDDKRTADEEPKVIDPESKFMNDEDNPWDGDDTYDDLDEEEDLLDEADHLLFDSLFETNCPVLYLEFVLGKLEKADPQYVQGLLSGYTPEDRQSLLKAIQDSKEYMAQVLKEREAEKSKKLGGNALN